MQDGNAIVKIGNALTADALTTGDPVQAIRGSVEPLITVPRMQARIEYVGRGRHAVVIVDGFTGRPRDIAKLAADLAPFPESRNGYPGLRRIISNEDIEAKAFVDFSLRRLAPLLGRSFGAARFTCLEASFSMVVTPPSELSPRQRMPHFDSTDPGYIAVLHYLSETAGTGFYRQRSTGIEMLTIENRPTFEKAAMAGEAGSKGYIAGSDTRYEKIGHVAGHIDRVVLYRGALLHSGVIDDRHIPSLDPLRGRLTANYFLQIG